MFENFDMVRWQCPTDEEAIVGCILDNSGGNYLIRADNRNNYFIDYDQAVEFGMVKIGSIWLPEENDYV